MKKSNSLNGKIRFFGFLFILPAFILVLFTMIIPVGWNIYLSFQEWNGASAMKFVGISNYIQVFSDKATMRSINNSVKIAVVATIFAMILGVFLALMIYKVSKREGAFYRFVFYSPAMLPMTVVGLLFTFILASDEGLLNNILIAIGLESLTRPWLAAKGTVLYAIGFVQGWRSSGTIMMLVFTAIIALPKSLSESAELDGATYLQEVRYIILPLIKPTIILSLSMMIMWAFKTYDIVAAMTGGGPGDLSKTAPIKIIEQAFTSNKYGFAAAISIIFALIVIALITIVRKGLKGEAYEY